MLDSVTRYVGLMALIVLAMGTALGFSHASSDEPKPESASETIEPSAHAPQRRLRFYIGENPWEQRHESMRPIDELCTRLFTSQDSRAYVRPTEIELSDDDPPKLIRLRFDLFHDCYCDYCGGRRKAELTNADLDIVAQYPSLEVLEMYGAEIANHGLARLSHLTELRRLNLSGTRIDGAGLKHLSKMMKLETLHLGGITFQVADLEPLVRLQRLQDLYLDTRKLDRRAFDFFAQFPRLRHLPYAARSNEELAKIAGFKHLEGLTGHSAITDEGLDHVAGMTALNHLDLTTLRISDDGLAKLAGLTELRSLNLSGTKITDDGLRHLAAMTKLETLELDRTRVSDNGVRHLQSCTSLTNLGLPDRQFAGHGLASLNPTVPLAELERPLQIEAEGVEHVNRLKKWRRLELEVSEACPRFEISDQPLLERLTLSFKNCVGELRIVNCPRLEPIEIRFETRHKVGPITVDELHLKNLPELSELICYNVLPKQVQSSDAMQRMGSVGLHEMTNTTMLHAVATHGEAVAGMTIYLNPKIDGADPLSGDPLLLNGLPRMMELSHFSFRSEHEQANLALQLLENATSLYAVSIQGVNISPRLLESLPKAPRLQNLHINGKNYVRSFKLDDGKPWYPLTQPLQFPALDVRPPDN